MLLLLLLLLLEILLHSVLILLIHRNLILHRLLDLLWNLLLLEHLRRSMLWHLLGHLCTYHLHRNLANRVHRLLTDYLGWWLLYGLHDCILRGM